MSKLSRGTEQGAATRAFRAMLDKRGVGWRLPKGPFGRMSEFAGSITILETRGNTWIVSEGMDGTLSLKAVALMPEQAVELTLGHDGPPYDTLIRALAKDHGLEVAWDGLRKFWDIELNEEGVRRRDALSGPGTCHEVMVGEFFRGCGECGYVWEYMYGVGNQTGPNFCPKCGKHIVREESE